MDVVSGETAVALILLAIWVAVSCPAVEGLSVETVGILGYSTVGENLAFLETVVV